MQYKKSALRKVVIFLVLTCDRGDKLAAFLSWPKAKSLIVEVKPRLAVLAGLGFVMLLVLNP